MNARRSNPAQLDFLEAEGARSLLDQLLSDAELYTTTEILSRAHSVCGSITQFRAVQCNAAAHPKTWPDLRSISSRLAKSFQAAHQTGRSSLADYVALRARRTRL